MDGSASQPRVQAQAQPPTKPLAAVPRAASRTRLSDGEKLQLVRLCLDRRDEYLGKKDVFWSKRTEEMNALLQRAGRRTNPISGARCVIKNLLKRYHREIYQVCCFFIFFGFGFCGGVAVSKQ
jgi:hypothetical protein